MSFKSDCDFKDFDEKRADFFYQNAIDLWKMLEESIQHIKKNTVVLLGYLLGSSSLLINLFFNPNAEKYQTVILILIVMHFLISINITLKIFLPKERTLPSLSPENLLNRDFNYENDGSIIELPQLKLKILQDVMDDFLLEINKLQMSLADVFKKNTLFTIFAPFASIIIAPVVSITMQYIDIVIEIMISFYSSPFSFCFFS